MNQGPFQALRTYILSKVVTVFNSDSSAYAYYTVFFFSTMDEGISDAVPRYVGDHGL